MTNAVCPHCGKPTDPKQFPQPGALLSLEQARKEHRCRICGETVEPPPRGRGGSIVLNYGEEFAHSACLEKP